ncbi:MAG: dependent epimerase/dehydratase family, partial [Thermoleophilia bacterium]|nr:dependent epimerase/dehydratase family [Thermoleophilia bacterium]
DAVVHLAWLIQPSHDVELLEAVNVLGTKRVLAAAAQARVPVVVVGSSIGAYASGPPRGRVEEHWPTLGIPGNLYSQQKSRQEDLVDRFERRHRDVRVVRIRSGLVFQAEAGASIRRLFAGPLLPRWILRRRGLPIVPGIAGLQTQCVHAQDLAEAYRLAIVNANARGPYNVATEPELSSRVVRMVLHARLTAPLPAPVLRWIAETAWRAHLQPTPGSWVDLAMRSPIMDTSRIRSELGWAPRWTAEEALADLIGGMGANLGLPTPPLAPDHGAVSFTTREFSPGAGITEAP